MKSQRLACLSAPFAAAFASAFLMPTAAHAQDATPPEGSNDKTATAGAAGSVTTQASQVEPPEAEDNRSTNVTEKPGKTYYFVGARYRGTIIPQGFMKLFVRGGATVFSNTAGIELDMRKDGFSFIPSLTYTEYGTGDILFLERGKPETANNWSVVNSSMKGIYANADLLWSTKVHRNVDLEYGVGFGIGAIFGSLVNNWVYDAPNGTGRYKDPDSGRTFNPCIHVTDSPDCQPSAHSNSQDAKVNGYEEKSWFDGGSKPPIFLHLAVPQLGVRIKPVKDFEARLTLGFSLTGFFFGLSANYGLEKALEKKSEPATSEQK